MGSAATSTNDECSTSDNEDDWSEGSVDTHSFTSEASFSIDDDEWFETVFGGHSRSPETSYLPTSIDHAPGASNYTYSLRKLEAGEFLLLKLLPGTYSERIRCRLSNHYVDSKPYFEALSYTWGEATLGHEVAVNGTFLPVTDNLHGALKRLRYSNNSRTIWVDALCINQKSSAERGHQVALMGKIYRAANKVLVRLGDPESALEDQEENALTQADSDANEQSLEKRQALALASAISVTQPQWWRRAWVAQEFVVAAREPLICFAQYQVSLAHAESLLGAIHTHYEWLQGDKYMKQSTAWDLTASIQGLRDLKAAQATPTASLFKAALCTWNLAASDPKDKVYSLLGLVTCSEASRVGVDYNANCEEIFRAATCACLAFRDLSALSAMRLGHECHAFMWYIDFSALPQSLPERPNDWTAFAMIPQCKDAEDHTKDFKSPTDKARCCYEMELTSNAPLLSCAGILIDKVHMVSQSIDGSHGAEQTASQSASSAAAYDMAIALLFRSFGLCAIASDQPYQALDEVNPCEHLTGLFRDVERLEEMQLGALPKDYYVVLVDDLQALASSTRKETLLELIGALHYLVWPGGLAFFGKCLLYCVDCTCLDILTCSCAVDALGAAMYGHPAMNKIGTETSLPFLTSFDQRKASMEKRRSPDSSSRRESYASIFYKWYIIVKEQTSRDDARGWYESACKDAVKILRKHFRQEEAPSPQCSISLRDILGNPVPDQSNVRRVFHGQFRPVRHYDIRIGERRQYQRNCTADRGETIFRTRSGDMGPCLASVQPGDVVAAFKPDYKSLILGAADDNGNRAFKGFVYLHTLECADSERFQDHTFSMTY